jgi:AcrR family transcriptional regulator
VSARVSEKRQLKLNEIIVVGTRLFNRRGFLATTMDEIANELSMKAATLYHYVKSKEELAYRCYLASCERRRSQIEFANRPGLDGLSRIRRFIWATLAPGEGRPAILSEVGALRQEWADHVRRVQRGNVQLVQQMVADGVRDRSITPMDPILAGIGVLGIVEWMTFWFTGRLPYSRDEIMATLEDVIVNGMTPKDEKPFDVPPITPAYPVIPAPDPFDREAIANLKLERFLRVAMESFNRVGVHATSIDQCARQLNLTKGAFYYYFSNKEELLYLRYKRALRFNWEAASHIRTKDPIEREILWRRSLFERHVSEHGPFPTYHHITFLAPKHRQEVVDELNKMQETDRGIVSRAMESGRSRPVDPFLAEKVRAGLTNWFPTWYSANGSRTPTEVADNHSNIFLYGLAPR